MHTAFEVSIQTLCYIYIMNKVVCIITILLFTISVHGQNGVDSYSFMVAGHTYGVPWSSQMGLHPPFKAKYDYITSRSDIKMCFLTGDMISRPTVMGWNAVDNDIDSLKIPVYKVAGNHDLKDKQLYISRYGNTYYQFTFNNDLFIILDSNEDNWSVLGEQLDFLKNTLNSNAKENNHVFVFFHHVLWSAGINAFKHVIPNSTEGRILPINFWSDIVPLFTKINSKVHMFAGDVGVSWASSVSYDKFENITFISSGMGGTSSDNFIIINVDSLNQVNYELICLNDTSLHCMGDLENYLVVDSSIVPSAIKVYPNPCSKILNVEVPFEENLDIKLLDMKGTVVVQKYVEGSCQAKFENLHLPKGIYVVRVVTKENCYEEKVILL